MALLIQIAIVLVVCGILLGVARAMPTTIDPWIRWGIYAITALVLCGWLLGLIGAFGPVGWRIQIR